MHEMSLAEGMLGIVEDTARSNGATRVTRVWIEIGALAHVAPEALRFCYDAVTRGSLAEGSTLEIVNTPGTAWCMPCGESVALPRLGEPCPRCGGFQLQVTAGDEMKVREIEIA